jgi:hypothetical protein
VETYPETNMEPTIFQVGHNKPKASDTVVEKKPHTQKHSWTLDLHIRNTIAAWNAHQKKDEQEHFIIQ